MVEQSTGPWSAARFAQARRAWLQNRVTELSEVAGNYCPRLQALMPAGLGDQRLVAALVTVRIAADEARVQPLAETVAWLELLVPQGHRHDLAGVVRDLRSVLVWTGECALWAWNVEAWEELLLSLWRRDRAQAVGDGQADDELISRWGVRTPQVSAVPRPERAPELHGQSLVPLIGFMEDETDPVRLLVQAVLAQPHAVEEIDDSLILQKEALQDAEHLEFLAEQRLSADYVDDWSGTQASEATEAGEGFLAELSDAVENYLAQVVRPVIESLSACEQEVLLTGEDSVRSRAHEYLREFLDEVVGPWAHADTEETFNAQVVQEAAAHMGRGELTWHGMRGSVPVWYHVVTSPQERAAALAYSGEASASVIRVHADLEEPEPRQFDLWSLDDFFEEGVPEDEEAALDWYPDPGIEIRYSGRSATDLCELPALARLGSARLEFLVPEPGARSPVAGSGTRALRAGVRPGDAAIWARDALSALRTLVRDVDDLVDAIANEREWEDGPGDADGEEYVDEGPPESPAGSGEEQGPADPTGPSAPDEPGAPPRPASGQLPATLLAKVKAILRQAEDRAATEAESAAFLKKATELMAKYGIEQAMLHGDEPTSEQPVDRVAEVTAPWMRECRRLLAWIADAMRCHAIYPRGTANRHRVHLFGFASDLQAVEVLYASLRLQMLGAEVANVGHRPANETTRAYKRSWMLGFVRAVTTRVAEAERTAREETERDRQMASPDTPPEGRSVALVLADRSVAVQAEVTSRYPKLGKTRGTKFKGSGFRQGYTDGQRADIGGLLLEEQEDEPELIA